MLRKAVPVVAAILIILPLSSLFAFCKKFNPSDRIDFLSTRIKILSASGCNKNQVRIVSLYIYKIDHFWKVQKILFLASPNYFGSRRIVIETYRVLSTSPHLSISLFSPFKLRPSIFAKNIKAVP